MPRPDRYTVETIMGNRVRYVVPSFYQRAYVWTLEKQWTDFWADIRRKTIELSCAKARAGHQSLYAAAHRESFYGCVRCPRRHSVWIQSSAEGRDRWAAATHNTPDPVEC